MWYSTSLAVSAAVFLLSVPSEAESLYSKKSLVVQANAKTFNRLVAKSNHTSIIEFYAPWCGHCKNLKPAYEKAAKKLQGLAKVVAVNCDDDANKQFCGEMGVKGFPTLKIARPSKKTGRPTIEEYQGARSAKAIVDAVVEKIPNHVKRVTDKSLGSWLKADNETAKAILFTEKGTTSALFRALAIDFLGSINFGQVRNKENSAVETFGIDKYPTLLLLPGGSKDGVLFDGDMKKESMTEFLSQIASPNPDPAPLLAKNSKSQDKKKATDSKATDGDSEKKHEPPKGEKPLAMIPPITDEATLREKCLSSTSKICALVLLPQFNPKEDGVPTNMVEALRSVAEVYDKHTRRHASFPIYLVEPSLSLVGTLRSELGLKPSTEIDIIAVNAKRGWWRKYSAADYRADTVEAWIDSIRMNEGKRESFPEGIITQVKVDEDEEEKEPELKAETKPKEHEEL